MFSPYSSKSLLPKTHDDPWQRICTKPSLKNQAVLKLINLVCFCTSFPLSLLRKITISQLIIHFFLLRFFTLGNDGQSKKRQITSDASWIYWWCLFTNLRGNNFKILCLYYDYAVLYYLLCIVYFRITNKQILWFSNASNTCQFNSKNFGNFKN